MCVVVVTSVCVFVRGNACVVLGDVVWCSVRAVHHGRPPTIPKRRLAMSKLWWLLRHLVVEHAWDFSARLATRCSIGQFDCCRRLLQLVPGGAITPPHEPIVVTPWFN